MFFPPAFCIHFPLQKITRRTYVSWSIECVQLLAATSKLKMVLLCPQSPDEMSRYPSVYCTVHCTMFYYFRGVSGMEALCQTGIQRHVSPSVQRNVRKGRVMQDWILVTCLTLSITIYLCLEECMEGRSHARLDSGDVSDPVPHHISVQRSVLRGGVLLQTGFW